MAKEAIEKEVKQGSLLFRLYEKAKKKLDRQEAPEDPEEFEEEQEQKTDFLHDLWEKWHGSGDETPFPLEEYVALPQIPVEREPSPDKDAPPVKLPPEMRDLDSFHQDLIRKAERIYRAVQADESGKAEQPPQIHLKLSRDKMKAWMFLFPPFGGEDLTEDGLKSALEASNIKYGVDSEMVHTAAEKKLYYRIMQIARGTPPVDGRDGTVTDFFPREAEIQLIENENGMVDYKDLNLFQEITKGTVICQTEKPTDMGPGTNVCGEPVKGYVGKPAVLPRGNNTVLSPDGTQLLAAIDGHLSFANNQFKVEKILIIAGDVDNAVGNLNFSGDISIGGDVREGFTVRAKGNISIRGMVEGAQVYAGGNIQINKGMNGNGKGILEAQGTIKSKFLENCKVYAKGTISADSIIGSDISCDGEVLVMTSKGAIIGGDFTVLKSLQAKVIGSKSNRATVIELGSTPQMHTKKEETEEKLKKVQGEIDEINKNIAYLERIGTNARQDQYTQMKMRKPALLMQVSRFTKELEQLEEEMGDLEGCRLQCGIIYPPTKIIIGDSSFVVRSVENRCIFYYHEGEVVKGTL